MPTVLILGASRGIGLEFVRQYRADGWRVIAAARTPEGVGALQALGAEAHQVDLSDAARSRAWAGSSTAKPRRGDLHAGVLGPAPKARSRSRRRNSTR